MTQTQQWDEHYEAGFKPWDTGFHDSNLERVLVEHFVRPGRALEIGCGTGTNAIWLSDRGFKVTAVDVANLAIQAACRKNGKTRNPRFYVLDVLSTKKIVGSPFDFIFDRGCFHSFAEVPDRHIFAKRVHALLSKNGLWCSLIGSKDGPEREIGPPRRSLREIIEVIEPHFEILEIRSSHFDSEQDDPPRCWVGVFRKRSQITA